MSRSSDDLGGYSLSELFGLEVETQAGVLTAGLLALERDPADAETLEQLMRAAHSIKGAARIVNREAAVKVAHALEECFVAAQRGQLIVSKERIDVLLRGVDLLSRLSQASDEEAASWEEAHASDVRGFLGAMEAPDRGERSLPALEPPPAVPPAGPLRPPAPAAGEPADRTLRVTAASLTRIVALAGESLVASRWITEFASNLDRLSRQQHDILRRLDELGHDGTDSAVRGARAGDLRDRFGALSETLAGSLTELELFDRRFVDLTSRLYREAQHTRMRPFGNGVNGFPRLVRDLARSLGKEARLEIVGEATSIDRDVLERLEGLLGHLLRNAVDHGVEPPAERLRAGKPAEGAIRLEAHHHAGSLLVEIEDDGRGIDVEAVRRGVVARGLATSEVAGRMSVEEVLEFLFLPGFSMKGAVTDVSGRGVGLDAVQSELRTIGGSVRISSRHGLGTEFQLRLPLTLSVVRALIVDIGAEPYAFPVARVGRVLKVDRARVESVEGREHFELDGAHVGLVMASQVLGLDAAALEGDLQVVVLGEGAARYGLVVDRFVGEQELVVRALDPRLGKVKDIAAAAVLPDRTPVLIVDVDDLIRSVEHLVSGGRLAHLAKPAHTGDARRRKRVLVVDDSLTVRELERKLLAGRGYDVEVAVDGMDGWNAVRTGDYDLVVTDVDMPRLDGIELVTLIRKDARLSAMPVMIVSYKDREEDHRRGLEAGADFYLTKGSFHDETLVRAVAELIGEAGE